MSTVPHFALPFRLSGPTTALRAVVNEQGTTTEIISCVEAIVRYPLGYRIELPGFGVPEQEFQQGGADIRAVQAAVDKWEPRAQAAAALDNTRLAELVSRVTVTVNGGTDT